MCSAVAVQHPIMGGRFSFFKNDKYYTVYEIAGEQARDKFWGAKVTQHNLNDRNQPLKFTVALKNGESLHYTKKINEEQISDGGQIVEFLHQDKGYTLKANKEITDQAVINNIEAGLGGVPYLGKRDIDEKWKNAEKNGEIIDIDAVDDRPAKKTKRQFITDLFKELRF